MYDAATWLRMFETLCARYRCRAIENIAFETDEDLCMAGPGGVWLAEITSVQFDAKGALIDSSYRGLRRFGARVLNTVDSSASIRRGGAVDDECEVAIDWFVYGSARERHGERRQCLVKTCRNSATIHVLLLANTVRYGELPPNGVAFSRQVDRLRPFALFLACDLLHRRTNFELLDMHYEPMASSRRWRDTMESADAEASWLDVGRDVHSRARWLRVVSNAPSRYELLDTMITQRSAGSGRIQYLWRDGRSMRAYGVNRVADGTLVNLASLDTELHSGRVCIMRLCDFDTFNRRCGLSLLMSATPVPTTVPSPFDSIAPRDTDFKYYVNHKGALCLKRHIAFS